MPYARSARNSKNLRGAEGDNYDSDTISKGSLQSSQRSFCMYTGISIVASGTGNSHSRASAPCDSRRFASHIASTGRARLRSRCGSCFFLRFAHGVRWGFHPQTPAWGTSSPRSTLVGQGSSDSPLGCHSLLPQFGKAEPSNSLLRFAAVLRCLFDIARQGLQR